MTKFSIDLSNENLMAGGGAVGVVAYLITSFFFARRVYANSVAKGKQPVTSVAYGFGALTMWPAVVSSFAAWCAIVATTIYPMTGEFRRWTGLKTKEQKEEQKETPAS